MNEVLHRKIQKLKEEVLYLQKKRTEFLKSVDISIDQKKIAERSIYLCAEIVLDIVEMVISIKGLPKPSTYSDSIYKLGDYDIVPKPFARKLVYIAGLRNFLAHDYQIDTSATLKKFLKSGIPDVRRFIDYMEKQ